MALRRLQPSLWAHRLPFAQRSPMMQLCAGLSSAATLPAQPTKVVYKKSRTGTFIGSLIGFLAGLTAAGASGFWALVEEYDQQASRVIAGLDQMDQSVRRIQAQVKKTEILEKQLALVEQSQATQDDIRQVRQQMLQTTDALTVEHLELKTKVWEMEKALLALRENQHQSVDTAAQAEKRCTELQATVKQLTDAQSALQTEVKTQIARFEKAFAALPTEQQTPAVPAVVDKPLKAMQRPT